MAETLAETALEVGLVVWPQGGQLDGEGDLILVGPPFIVGEDEISELVGRLRTALDRTLERLRERKRRQEAR
jgi:adenosylmethionine-8-amino-7-oxononanoate aminotransferase